MPLASQKRVGGVSRFVRADGRNRSQSVAPMVAIGRNRSQSVAIWRAGRADGRNRSGRCRKQGTRHKKKPDSQDRESGSLLLLGVVRFYASASSSAK